MKWHLRIKIPIEISIGISLVFLTALLIGAFIIVVQFIGLSIVSLKEVRENWQWTEWYPWIAVVWFFWMYLAIGIKLGITWQERYLEYLRYLAKHRNDKRRFLFICTYFQIFLSGISWPLLVSWRFVVGEGNF